jgi:fatty-acyl-CoA synthase
MPGFEPGLLLDLVESERAAVVGAVPTMLMAAIEQPDLARRDLTSLRCVVSGGSTVPPELVRRIESQLGVRFSIGYGQTESTAFITQTRLDDSPEDRAETLGQPNPQTEVKIVDPATGAVLPTGTIGEICTRGPLVMRGYFDKPEATAAAIEADGWLHTGDLGSMDDRGYCRIAGRLKDMIIRGGENIYPREIEQLLCTHSAVADVAVVGVPDPRWGEQVAAFVRAAPGQTPTTDELFALCREHLAPYKTPRYWEFVERFPMTATGKVQKFLLRQQFVADHPAPG